jgi:hypothetical protein
VAAGVYISLDGSIFPTVLWGVGLTLNGWGAYLRTPITEADVEQVMRRLRAIPPG